MRSSTSVTPNSADSGSVPVSVSYEVNSKSATLHDNGHTIIPLDVTDVIPVASPPSTSMSISTSTSMSMTMGMSILRSLSEPSTPFSISSTTLPLPLPADNNDKDKDKDNEKEKEKEKEKDKDKDKDVRDPSDTSGPPDEAYQQRPGRKVSSNNVYRLTMFFEFIHTPHSTTSSAI